MEKVTKLNDRRAPKPQVQLLAVALQDYSVDRGVRLIQRINNNGKTTDRALAIVEIGATATTDPQRTLGYVMKALDLMPYFPALINEVLTTVSVISARPEDVKLRKMAEGLRQLFNTPLVASPTITGNNGAKK